MENILPDDKNKNKYFRGKTGSSCLRGLDLELTDETFESSDGKVSGLPTLLLFVAVCDLKEN